MPNALQLHATCYFFGSAGTCSPMLRITYRPFLSNCNFSQRARTNFSLSLTQRSLADRPNIVGCLYKPEIYVDSVTRVSRSALPATALQLYQITPLLVNIFLGDAHRDACTSQIALRGGPRRRRRRSCR